MVELVATLVRPYSVPCLHRLFFLLADPGQVCESRMLERRTWDSWVALESLGGPRLFVRSCRTETSSSVKPSYGPFTVSVPFPAQ